MVSGPRILQPQQSALLSKMQSVGYPDLTPKLSIYYYFVERCLDLQYVWRSLQLLSFAVSRLYALRFAHLLSRCQFSCR